MKRLIQTIGPFSFAYVMATGAVSIILNMTHWLILSKIFVMLAFLGYIGLICLFAAKIYLTREALLPEIVNVQTLFKCFTFSAGKNSLASIESVDTYKPCGYC
jgi:hypothetical protein